MSHTNDTVFLSGNSVAGADEGLELVRIPGTPLVADTPKYLTQHFWKLV